MIKSFKTKRIVISALLAILILSASAFSVSYAKWAGMPLTDAQTSAATGEWKIYDYALFFEDKSKIDLVYNASDASYRCALNVEENVEKSFYIYYESKLIEFSVAGTAVGLLKREGYKYTTSDGAGLYKINVKNNQILVDKTAPFSELIQNENDVKNVMAEILGQDPSNVTGAITSTGQIVNFEEPVTLKAGEEIVMFGNGDPAKGGTQWLPGSWGISSSQSSDCVSVTNGGAVVTAKENCTVKIEMVKGNINGGAGGIFQWIAVKDVPSENYIYAK